MQTYLAKLRAKKQLSQIQLADLLGTTKQTVSRWERGVMLPRRYFIERLCFLFGCEESALGFRNTEDVPDLVPSVNLYDIPLPPAIPLVGREQELARIKEELTEKRVTTLHGLPGVGKTSLAIALVHDEQLRTSFEGIFWAVMGPTPDLAGTLNRWGALLGQGETFLSLDIREKCQKLRTAIGMRPLLLVLDDIWDLEHAHVLLSGGGPNCGVLLTTRFLAIAADVDACQLSELNAEQSIGLLRQLAPEVVDREETKVRELIATVGGLPLALTLLGHYLRKESYHVPMRRAVAALERLSSARVRFETSIRADMKKEAISLQSSIAVTDRFLTPSARDTLYALSVFPSKPENFSEEAALVAAACTTRELDELLDVGLLEAQGADHYRLHPIIADYGRLHLGEQAERIVRQRLLAYENLQEDGATSEEIVVEVPAPVHTSKGFVLSTRNTLIVQLRKSAPRGLEWKHLPNQLEVGRSRQVFAAFIRAWSANGVTAKRSLLVGGDRRAKPPP